jgi:hypothetical protein
VFALEDWLIALVSLASGLLGGAFVFVVREGLMYPRRLRERRGRAVVERKLEKLYNPLYTLVKYAESVSENKKPALTFLAYGMSHEEIIEGQKRFDSMILNYAYLAEDDLHQILPRIICAGFYKEENKETMERTVQLIIGGYETLRKEYYRLMAE